MSSVHRRSVPRVALRATVPGWRLARLVALLRSSFKRASDRRELAELSDEQLRDVGLSRRMIEREIEKPFWMA